MTDANVSNTPNGPLGWLRVVDLADLRGSMCGRILADLGADVIHVERPGTPAETITSTAYRYRNANKRGTTLDLGSIAGDDRLHVLLSDADVLIENFDLSERASLGLAPDVVATRYPQLVHIALTDLGLSGPRAGWHLEALPALASSGALFASGPLEFPPCNAPGYVAHDCASLYGAIAAVAGVLDRARNGAGQLFEISTQEAALHATVPWSIPLRDYQRFIPELPAEGKRNGDGTYWVLPASDGYVRTVPGTNRHWDGFVKLLGSPEALLDEAWHDRGFRIMNSDVVRMVAQDSMTDRTREQLFEESLGLAPLGIMQTVREFVDHPQTKHRKFFIETGFEGIGDAPFARHPVNLAATPASIRRAAPAPGEDAEGFAPRTEQGAAKVAADTGYLLSGLRVIEITAGQLVPELCGMLSDFGADIIKIESRAHPDLLRGVNEATMNKGFAFNTGGRGRRSVAIDLTNPEGRELAKQLCADADIIAENQRGGVLDRLGLSYDEIKKINPDIIYVSSQGYGRGGPFGEMQAYGPLNAGFAGAHLMWNHPEAPYPSGTTLTYPDAIGGKLLTVAVLAALNHRAATGEGQYLEMAQTELVAYFFGQAYLDAAQAGADPVPLGNRNPDAAPHGVYPSAGDDEWVAIAVADDSAWDSLCKTLGWEDGWAQWPLSRRLAEQDHIDERLSAWTRTLDKGRAAELLQENGVSAMPVMGPDDQHADPHLTEREYIIELIHPEVGPEHYAGNPIRPSRLPMRVGASAPGLGQHTAEILKEVLGLDEPTIDDLVVRGVCR
ncbi:CoA transferase [Jatrophihabitans sp.]|uniref:CaiB/BaiF CoA-transferase family protein n=1 Tax=Jatrophihabitans sp. TaxID=1932789 RepID=UPI0030C67AA3|nr:CoA-transferase [Jatrophihabitans sp.]